MKRVFILFTVFLLCFSVAGCDGTSDPSEKQESAKEISYTDAVVSYLGPEGTYTQEACMKFFNTEGTYVPYVTVDEAVEALVTGESDYAVIPQENTIGGAVTDYVDTLIQQTEVSVTGEIELPISQNLLVLKGTSLSDIQTVYSHKQGIAQGKEWLEKNLPEAEVIEVSSTAEGAKMVSEKKDHAYAAIASAACAEVYDLDILAASIQNNDKNKTRFYVLSMDKPKTGTGERLAFIATGKAEDLLSLMADMEEQKMTLITIHDRPLKTELGEYYYLIECTNSSYKNYEALTKKSSFTFRYLGSFDAY